MIAHIIRNKITPKKVYNALKRERSTRKFFDWGTPIMHSMASRSLDSAAIAVDLSTSISFWKLSRLKKESMHFSFSVCNL